MRFVEHRLSGKTAGAAMVLGLPPAFSRVMLSLCCEPISVHATRINGPFGLMASKSAVPKALQGSVSGTAGSTRNAMLYQVYWPSCSCSQVDPSLRVPMVGSRDADLKKASQCW